MPHIDASSSAPHIAASSSDDAMDMVLQKFCDFKETIIHLVQGLADKVDQFHKKVNQLEKTVQERFDGLSEQVIVEEQVVDEC